ncbi:MAG: NTE family protein [Cyclobacteriaceae bacterium]|jgi:NTE family protein
MKIGLALAGGGARAIAHLGMMQVIEDHRIDISAVSGASAGALVGALYCQGFPPKEILAIVKKTNILRIVKPALSWQGLLKLDSVYTELKKYLGHDRFEELKKPLFVSATNIAKGKVKYFKKGQLIQPILASCSIPVVFNPVKINGIAYMDGGILDNLPYKPLKKKVDKIIGLHCNPINPAFKSAGWKSLMERALLLSISSSTLQSKNKFDVFWEAPDVTKYNVFDFKKADDLYKTGYDYAIAHQHELAPFVPVPIANE